MLPKPKSIVNKKGAINLSKRPPRKSTRKGIVTNPLDLDNIHAVADNGSGAAANIDIASRLDMVMTMMADLSNKVTVLEWAHQIAPVPAT